MCVAISISQEYKGKKYRKARLQIKQKTIIGSKRTRKINLGIN